MICHKNYLVLIKKMFIILLKFYSITFLLFIFSYPVLGYTVRTDHPRLFITNNNLAEIRTKIQNYYQEEFQRFIDELDTYYFEGDPKDRTPITIQNFAFLYQLGNLSGFTYQHNALEYGQRAKDLLVDFINDKSSIGVDSSHDLANSDENAIPVGYDWLYNLLNESEKQQIANLILSSVDPLTSELNSEYPLSHKSACEAIILPLAIYGDGYDDVKLDNMLDNFYKWITSSTGILGIKNFIAGEQGGDNSGLGGYGDAFAPDIAWVVDAWRTATGEGYFSNSSYLKYYPYWYLYSNLPYTLKTVYNDHHSAAGQKMSSSQLNIGQHVYSKTSPDRAALSNWIIQTKDVHIHPPYIELWGLYSYFIWGDPSITPKSPSQLNLPLTQHFEGLGLLIMRQGFEDVNNTMAGFKSMPYAYQSGCYWWGQGQNSFFVHKHGPLTMNTGTGAHHSYGNTDISKNVIIFYDENNNKCWRNFPNLKDASDLLPNSDYDIGGVKRYESFEKTAKYDYIYGDASQALDPNKVNIWSRQFVYFRPNSNKNSDYMVIFDRTEVTDSSINKKWLLHMSYEPEINGMGSQVREGKWVYNNADLVTITNNYGSAHGRLFAKTLLPKDNYHINKIGGPNHECDIFGENDEEGAHLSFPLSDGDAFYVGSYRTEVVTSGNQYDVFLHVMQTADTQSNSQSFQMVQTERIDGTTMVGAHIASSSGQHEWVTMFSRTEENQSQAIYDVTVWTDSLYHLIADLEPNTYYNVYQDGDKFSMEPSSEAGTLYFKTLGGGNFQITQGDPVPLPIIKDVTPDTLYEGLQDIQIKGKNLKKENE